MPEFVLPNILSEQVRLQIPRPRRSVVRIGLFERGFEFFDRPAEQPISRGVTVSRPVLEAVDFLLRVLEERQREQSPQLRVEILPGVADRREDIDCDYAPLNG